MIYVVHGFTVIGEINVYRYFYINQRKSTNLLVSNLPINLHVPPTTYYIPTLQMFQICMPMTVFKKSLHMKSYLC